MYRIENGGDFRYSLCLQWHVSVLLTVYCTACIKLCLCRSQKALGLICLLNSFQYLWETQPCAAVVVVCIAFWDLVSHSYCIFFPNVKCLFVPCYTKNMHTISPPKKVCSMPFHASLSVLCAFPLTDDLMIEQIKTSMMSDELFSHGHH